MKKKKLLISETDGWDVYSIREVAGIKQVRIDGWFYDNDEGFHYTDVSSEDVSITDFISKYKADTVSGYNDEFEQMIDSCRQYITDFRSEEDAQASLEELELTVLPLGSVDESTPCGCYISPRKYE